MLQSAIVYVAWRHAWPRFHTKMACVWQRRMEGGRLVEVGLYLEFSQLKLNYFQYSSCLFPKVFWCKISWNFNEWFSRNRRISESAILHSIAKFWTYHACAAVSWVLSVTKKKLRIAGFFASLPFVTYSWTPLFRTRRGNEKLAGARNSRW